MTPNKHPVKDTNRIETFSDGVFAIAITLLVLNIQERFPLRKFLPW